MYEIAVAGMSCTHCVSRVTRAIKEVDATAHVAVDVSTGIVSVQSSLERSDFETALDEAGYPPLS